MNPLLIVLIVLIIAVGLMIRTMNTARRRLQPRQLANEEWHYNHLPQPSVDPYSFVYTPGDHVPALNPADLASRWGKPDEQPETLDV